MRAGRITSLKKLCSAESDRLLIGNFVPDGVGEGADEASFHPSSEPPKLLPSGEEDQPPPPPDQVVDPKGAQEEPQPRVLKNARSCYTCKARFNVLHSFYDQLCPACAELNWKKRVQTRPLIGENGTPYVSIVTGGRVKIGHRIVLKLLRAGSLVVATTRFPVAGAKVYEKYGEEYERWIKEGRLHVVGLDLRDLVSVER